MRYINAQGIIIKNNNLSEQDQFITLYSPTLGKIESVAKGARKIDSHFTGHLEVLNVCNIQIYKGPHRYTLTQCQSTQTFKNIKNNLNLTIPAFLVIEIFHRIIHGNENSQELFNLLINTLTKLNNNTGTDIPIEHFKIKILKITGSLPNVSNCTECNHRWEENDTIHIDDKKHIHCGECCKNTKTSIKIPFNIMKLINFLTETKEDENLTKLKLKKTEKEILKAFTGMFLGHYIETQLNSEKIAVLLHTRHVAPKVRSARFCHKQN